MIKVSTIPPEWNRFLNCEYNKEYFKGLKKFISSEFSNGKTIYPSVENVFTAFQVTPLKSVKVVIIGQDPYHGEGQAHGLSFSVPSGVKLPPSLRNIYKELNSDLGGERSSLDGDLSSWAKQGVLLLNSVLTVESGKAGSHQKKGWEIFTDKVVEVLNNECSGIIFMLWGAQAHKKGSKIDEDKHFVLRSTHPSPLSSYRGFFGCKHFSKANSILEKEGKKIIDWSE